MTTIENLKSTGAAYRFNGIMSCLEKGVLLKEEVDLLKTLTQDEVVIAGRKLSAYASAALDLLGVEKYDGKDVDVKQLIAELK